jgi:hypothetical protein
MAAAFGQRYPGGLQPRPVAVKKIRSRMFNQGSIV